MRDMFKETLRVVKTIGVFFLVLGVVYAVGNLAGLWGWQPQ